MKTVIRHLKMFRKSCFFGLLREGFKGVAGRQAGGQTAPPAGPVGAKLAISNLPWAKR